MMFSRTPVAKQFRRWVLDVLDKLEEEERAKTELVKNLDRLPFLFPLSSLRTERHREREDLHLSGIRSGQGAAGNMDTVQPAFPDCGILPASDGTHGRSAGLPVPPLS